MRQGNGRVQRGLVAKFSDRWHALPPDEYHAIKDCLLDSQSVVHLLRIAGDEGTNIDFVAFYETPEEDALLRDALASLGLQKELPASAQGPILRDRRGDHSDLVIMAQRLPGGGFAYTGFMIP